MPIYEYECRKCGHGFDAMQKVSEGPLRKCPACGALKLQRLVSAPQFRLKGTGWYETDFKKDGQKRLADGTDGGDAKPAAEADKTAKPEKAGKPEKAEPKKDKKPATGAASGSPASTSSSSGSRAW